MELVRETRSVCPVCLKNLPAQMEREETGGIFLSRVCPDHGPFRALVWQGAMDFDAWCRAVPPMAPGAGERCPQNCGICPEHGQGSCCVLLEVTRRCDLRCRFCFADGGSPGEDPSLEAMKAAVDDIVSQRGQPLLQLSGGEPTLRDDLPELVRHARAAGCSHVQVNTNGLRLARDPEYARRLRDAGLDIVFLQFDGTREEIFQFLRGRSLLEEKLEAIRVCGQLGLGVTLVPTLVPGVNTDDLGGILELAKSLAPAVRGIHFQPVSYFGRFPEGEAKRYTLDRLMADLADQGGLSADVFMPSRCDHPLCGFHANFLVRPDGSLRPLSSFRNSQPTRGDASRNRSYVARHWRGASGETPEYQEEMDFDDFLQYMRTRSLAVSAMAFQDAGNLNIERLRQCSLHVYQDGVVKPFCANYLTAWE